MRRIFFSTITSFVSLAILALIGQPLLAFAANSELVIRDESYAGSYVSQSIADPIAIPAGTAKMVVVKIKNTGTAAWESAGARRVSAYTVAPKYRGSIFKATDWPGEDQTQTITKRTAPGGVAELRINLVAPKTSGNYVEKFNLAAENTTWIKGAGFFLQINVVAATKATVPTVQVVSSTLTTSEPVPENLAVTTPGTALAAKLVTASHKAIEAAGGEAFTVLLSFTNTGSSSWQGYEWNEALSRALSTSSSDLPINLADSSWLTAQRVLASDTSVEPGQTADITFTLRMPVEPGAYLARFALTTAGQSLRGGIFELPLTVSTPAPQGYAASTFTSRALVPPPTIRVGLYSPSKPVLVKTSADYRIFNGPDEEGLLPVGETATLAYKNGTYSFVSEKISFAGKKSIRLVPDDLMATFTLTNYERRLSGRLDNFNTYRGILELAYASTSKAPYVINELSLDEYIAGVAEVSNGSPPEYVLAMAVTERSYAYYHRQYATAAGKAFHVVPTTADQLYLGYTFELTSPKVAAAAYATRGQVVTYQGVPVVTPYFSHSDGRTRSWSEAWGGASKPWLVSVAAVYDVGKSMLGHGVGMSGLDALLHAGNDGWKYDEILRYYYSGTKVEKIY